MPGYSGCFFCVLEGDASLDGGAGGGLEQSGWGLGVTHLRRSANAKEAAREGTYNIQRESLMLSRLRLYWEVILENHFPSLAGGFFYVSPSKPRVLNPQPPSTLLKPASRSPSRLAARIR